MKKTTRNELLSSKEYWMGHIQHDLFGAIEKYMQENKLNRTSLAKKLGVTKGYITQVLNGDFDHKVSKLVELALASNVVPVLHFVNLQEFLANDSNDKVYELMPVVRNQKSSIQYQELEASPINEINSFEYTSLKSKPNTDPGTFSYINK